MRSGSGGVTPTVCALVPCSGVGVVVVVGYRGGWPVTARRAGVVCGGEEGRGGD